MTKQRRGWELFATALLALLLAFPALATKGTKAPNPNKGHSKITAVIPTSITVTPMKRDAKTFAIAASTKLKPDRKAAILTDLAVGQHAYVKSKDGTTAPDIKAYAKGSRKGGKGVIASASNLSFSRLTLPTS